MWFSKVFSNLFHGPQAKPLHSGVTDTQVSNLKIDSNLKVVTGDVNIANTKVIKILQTYGEDFCGILSALECSENRAELQVALKRFNKIMRIFFIAAPSIDYNEILVNTLKRLGCSQRFESFLNSRFSVKDAVISYKTEIVKKLNSDFKLAQELLLAEEGFDKALLDCYLPKPNPSLFINETTTLGKDTLTNMESQENRDLGNNKRSSPTDSPPRSVSPNKKRKTMHNYSSTSYQHKCSNHEHGNCRRGSNCRYRH